jgi:hypothetical protein
MIRIVKPSNPRPTRTRRRPRDDVTGKALIAALQASPHRDIDLEPSRTPMPVGEVSA